MHAKDKSPEAYSCLKVLTVATPFGFPYFCPRFDRSQLIVIACSRADIRRQACEAYETYRIQVLRTLWTRLKENNHM